MTDRTASRDAQLIALGTVVSRVTGLLRVLVAAGVMGTGALGGLYETTNRIPNFLFDLFAGGALQAVLVPAFVRAREEGGEAGLRRLADAVAGSLAAFCGMVVAVGMAASPLIVRAFTAAEPNGAIRAEKNALGTSFALVFIPQVLCYALVVVASAALAARGRFVAAALAPAVNNIVLIGVYAGFWGMRRGSPPTLDLTAGQFALLAGGTTLAVVVFAAVPVALAVRARVMGWPRLDREVAAQTGLHRAGGWAILQMSGMLSLNFVAIGLGNGAENGTGVFLWGQNLMLFALGLVSVPLATAISPRLVRARSNRDDALGRATSEGAVLTSIALIALASSLLAGLGWPIARLLAFGEAARDGYAPLARTTVVFGVTLIGPGVVWVLNRMLFSIDDARGAAVITVVMAILGTVFMLVSSGLAERSDRSVALALGYGLAYVVGSAALVARYRQRSGWLGFGSWWRPATVCSVAAVGLGFGLWWLADRFPASRVGSVGALAVCVPAAVLAYAVALRILGGRPLKRVLDWEH